MCESTRHWSSRPIGGGSGCVTPVRLVKVATAGDVAVSTRRSPTLSEPARRRFVQRRLDADDVELGERRRRPAASRRRGRCRRRRRSPPAGCGSGRRPARAAASGSSSCWKAKNGGISHALARAPRDRRRPCRSRRSRTPAAPRRTGAPGTRASPGSGLIGIGRRARRGSPPARRRAGSSPSRRRVPVGSPSLELDEDREAIGHLVGRERARARRRRRTRTSAGA